VLRLIGSSQSFLETEVAVIKTWVSIVVLFLVVASGLSLVFIGQSSGEGYLTVIWKTVYVDVDGDNVDEALVLRTDEDVYHLGAAGSSHLHVGILGSGPGWGLQYVARMNSEPLLDTGIRGGYHYYNSRVDFLEDGAVVTEWEADKVLLRRTIDLTAERAIIVFELVNLLPEHIRNVYFTSQFRFDDYIYPTSSDSQTTLGWDGYNPNSPDTPAIFKILHLPKPDTFVLDPGPYYGLTSATWGPLDLCAERDLEYALVPVWNNGYDVIDDVIEYLDHMVSHFKSMQDEIVDPPVECDNGLVIDIKPRSCPNPVNVKSKGVLPVAILGTSSMKVGDIDVSTILLEDVPPIRTAVEDVSRPVGTQGGIPYGLALDGSAVEGGSRVFQGKEFIRSAYPLQPPEEDETAAGPTPIVGDFCQCTTEGPDGYEDLTMKFETEDVVAALGEVGDRDTLVLTLIARTRDGTELEGWDCIVFLDNEERKADRQPPDQTQLAAENPQIHPLSFLHQNQPNPFRKRTTITFSLAKGSHTRLVVQDISGRCVERLVDRRLPPGLHSAVWDSEAPRGIYICRLEAEGLTSARKMLLIR
jgi:hypothetical protein